jgi:hypothetical protein
MKQAGVFSKTKGCWPSQTKEKFVSIIAIELLCLSQLLVLIRMPMTALRTGEGVLCTGADSPRLGTGRSVTWHRAQVPCLMGRTVHAYSSDGPRVHRGGGVRRWRLNLAPGRDPVGVERP